MIRVYRTIALAMLIVSLAIAQQPQTSYPQEYRLSAPAPSGITNVSANKVGTGQGYGQYWYFVVVDYAMGSVLPTSDKVVTVRDLPSLSASTYVKIDWLAVPNATSYTVFRNTSSTFPTIPCTACVVAAATTSLTANDQGSLTDQAVALTILGSTQGYLRLINDGTGAPNFITDPLIATSGNTVTGSDGVVATCVGTACDLSADWTKVAGLAENNTYIGNNDFSGATLTKPVRHAANAAALTTPCTAHERAFQVDIGLEKKCNAGGTAWYVAYPVYTLPNTGNGTALGTVANTVVWTANVAASEVTTGDEIRCACAVSKTGTTNLVRSRFKFGGTATVATYSESANATDTGYVLEFGWFITGSATQVSYPGMIMRRPSGAVITGSHTVSTWTQDTTAAFVIDFEAWLNGATDTGKLEMGRCVVYKKQ